MTGETTFCSSYRKVRKTEGYEFQFGFRKGHSTSQAITEITENLRKAVDNNMYSCGVFLDFSKAFDTVNHKILLLFFTSYLTNRKQYTSLGNYLSSMQTVSCGVPQGKLPRACAFFNLH